MAPSIQNTEMRSSNASFHSRRSERSSRFGRRRQGGDVVAQLHDAPHQPHDRVVNFRPEAI